MLESHAEPAESAAPDRPAMSARFNLQAPQDPLSRNQTTALLSSLSLRMSSVPQDH